MVSPPGQRRYLEDSTDVITVEGSTRCPPYYVREYFGWLMSAHNGHRHRIRATCVDANAEAPPGYNITYSSTLNHVGKYAAFYPMEMDVEIGAYQSQSEMVCAVCSRCVDCPVYEDPSQAAGVDFEPSTVGASAELNSSDQWIERRLVSTREIFLILKLGFQTCKPF